VTVPSTYHMIVLLVFQSFCPPTFRGGDSQTVQSAIK